ncbi:MAG: Bacterial domain [Patescibacteria group bacterium]|jgi:membrane protein YdbS with pleckstrin-like domain|nr:Bacterial domain [Patescibacteria group bacterium]
MARQNKTSTSKDTSIQLSKRALLYFFGYHWWAAFKKLILWVLILIVATTALGLIRSAEIFGMADEDIAKSFLNPMPRSLAAFLAIITVYALIRAIISTKSTKYAFTPKGVVIQSGWPTRRTTIVDYGHIQKMTIVSNPFDRMLRAAYVQLDLIGGAPGVLLEAVDAQAVKDIQEKLSIPNHALLAAVTPALEKPKEPMKDSEKKPAKKTSKKATKPKKTAPKKTTTKASAKKTTKKSVKKITAPTRNA